MVLLILIILHVMVNIQSNFLHLHIPLKHTRLLIVKLFLLVKWYVKEITSFQSKLILIIMFYKKLNPLAKCFL